MKNITIIFILIGFVTSNCGSTNSPKERDKIPKDSFYNDSHKNSKDNYSNPISIIHRKIIEIEKKSKISDSISCFFLSDNLVDTLFVLLYHQDMNPIKLKYTTFDDGGYAKGYGAFYFIKNQLYAQNLYLGTKNIIEVYLADNRVLKYRPSDDGFQIIKMDSLSAKYREATAILSLDIFMQCFTEVEYYTSIPSYSINPILITKLSTDLYPEPSFSSEKIRNLEEGTKLKYFGSNKVVDTLNNLSWIWYHVVLPNNDRGWVFGHPNYISTLAD